MGSVNIDLGSSQAHWDVPSYFQMIGQPWDCLDPCRAGFDQTRGHIHQSWGTACEHRKQFYCDLAEIGQMWVEVFCAGVPQLASAGGREATASDGRASVELRPRFASGAAPSNATPSTPGPPHFLFKTIACTESPTRCSTACSAVRSQLGRGCGSRPTPTDCKACTVLHRANAHRPKRETRGGGGCCPTTGWRRRRASLRRRAKSAPAGASAAMVLLRDRPAGVGQPSQPMDLRRFNDIGKAPTAPPRPGKGGDWESI